MKTISKILSLLFFIESFFISYTPCKESKA